MANSTVQHLKNVAFRAPPRRGLQHCCPSCKYQQPIDRFPNKLPRLGAQISWSNSVNLCVQSQVSFVSVPVITGGCNKNFSRKMFHEEYLVIRMLREWNLKQQECLVIMTLMNRNV